MTEEQKAAVTACIEAFNIPRDCREFKLVLSTDYAGISYGQHPRIVARLEVDHASISPAEV